MQLKLDLHIHSNYSFDSDSKINKIVRSAKKKGLDGIAITDHEEFSGAELAEKVRDELIVIKGQEINTEYGDVIGLFLTEKVRSKKFDEVIKEIKKQKGIVIIPHPAVYHLLTESLIKKADAIEVFNSRIGKEANRMALFLASKFKKSKIAGSDAHFLFEIGNGVTIVNVKNKNLEEIKKTIILGRTSINKNYPSILEKVIIRGAKLWKRKR